MKAALKESQVRKIAFSISGSVTKAAVPLKDAVSQSKFFSHPAYQLWEQRPSKDSDNGFFFLFLFCKVFPDKGRRRRGGAIWTQAVAIILLRVIALFPPSLINKMSAIFCIMWLQFSPSPTDMCFLRMRRRANWLDFHVLKNECALSQAWLEANLSCRSWRANCQSKPPFPQNRPGDAWNTFPPMMQNR